MNLRDWYEKVAVIPQQTDEAEIDYFASLIPKTPRLDVCDVGCAEGKLPTKLAGWHNVVACDISQSFLDKIPDNLQKICCDIEENIEPFNGSTFDVVYLMDTIEHLKSPYKALENIRRILKPQGVLFINTPNVMSYRNFRLHIMHPRASGNYFNPENLHDLHLSVFDFFGLEKLLNFVGFRAELISKHYFATNILVRCTKVKPINVPRQIEYWNSKKK